MKVFELLNESTEYDAKKTYSEAASLMKVLKSQFNVAIDDKSNSDGSITITLNNGSVVRTNQDDNPNILTAKNLSAAIDKQFRDYRQKGWYFSQPVNGSFTIGVK